MSFLAYKLKSKSWCQLTLKNQQAEYSTRQALVQVLNNNTVVRLANPFEIQFHNLVEKHSWVKTINQTSSQDRVTIDCLAASKNELYCVRNFSVYTKFPFSATTRFEKQRSILLLPSKIRSGTACFHSEFVTQLCCLHTSGSITDTAVISQPLLTVPGEVKSLCFTGGVACMLMRNTDILVMYAVYECVITFLNVEEYNIDFESFICPSQFGGLYLISESDILQIDILVSPKCINAEIVGMNRREDKTPLHSNLRNPFRPRVEISGDKIITVTRTLHEPKLQYQLLPSDIGELEDQAIIDIEWPKNVRHFGYRFDCHFMQLQLPNEATRCAIDCPHCKA